MVIKCIIENTKKIYNLSEKQLDKIKKDLTYLNPKYLSAKKFSRRKNININKYIFYYIDRVDYLEVPRGYNVPFRHKTINKSKEVTIKKYTPFKLKLRDTQKQAYEKYTENYNNGLIVMPTGKGKSILGLYLAYALKQKTLVIVHKDDLVDGWTQDSKLCFGEDFKIGLIKAKSKKVGTEITIATIQTLNLLDKKFLKELYNEFGLVIIDEAHHISASTYTLVNNFNARYKVGLTATPEREDGLEDIMNLYLGGICFQAKIDTNDTDILPVEVLIKNSNLEFTPYYKVVNNKWQRCSSKNKNAICIKDIPYKDRPRIQFNTIDNFVVLNTGFMKLVSKDVIAEYKKGHSCILFFNQKEHINAYYDYLIEHGLTKIQKYYGDSKEPKSVMKKRAENKEVLITLATYSIATEGTNVKAWEVAFIIGGVNNGKNIEQAIGRIRRSKEGKINPCKVYDYAHHNVYSMANHINTHKARYNKLHFKIKEEGIINNRNNFFKNNTKTSKGKRDSIFKRGFN